MKLSITRTATAFLSLVVAAAQTPIQDPLLRWMDSIAQEQLDARDSAIAAVHSIEDAERRKEFVRKKILEAVGGLPVYEGPLNARITGEIRAEGYVIEKLIYESLPGY